MNCVAAPAVALTVAAHAAAVVRLVSGKQRERVRRARSSPAKREANPRPRREWEEGAAQAFRPRSRSTDSHGTK